MNTNVIGTPSSRFETHGKWRMKTHGHHGVDALRYAVPVGRLLLSSMFLLYAPAHFSEATVAYGASAGVPLPGLLVPLAGLIAIVGAVMVALGFHAKLGAWLLVLFLVPVTFMMHRFWNIPDPGMARMQSAMFWKNIAMLGGTLLVTYYGAGPISMDERRAKAGAKGETWETRETRE